jgi:hypothetical protein
LLGVFVIDGVTDGNALFLSRENRSEAEPVHTPAKQNIRAVFLQLVRSYLEVLTGYTIHRWETKINVSDIFARYWKGSCEAK